MASPYKPVVASPACGNTINLDALHFTPDELRSLNELIVTAVLSAPELTAFHTFWTGIKNDKRIGIIPGSFGLIGKAAQACDPVPHCHELVAIEKTWEPRYLEVLIDMCVDEVQDTLMRMALKCGVDLYDLTQTEIATFLGNILENDIKKMIFRYAWFGNQAAANFPGGVITPGVDVDYFNVLNGFFQQIAEIYALTPERRTAMAGNDQLTYELQRTVATPVLTMAGVNQVIDSAVPELNQQPDRVLLVTQSVFQRLRRGLQAVGTVFQDYKLMTNGIEFANWDGIPMYALPAWDEIIAAYENNGTTWNLPHRVVYTTKSNLNIGMVCTSLFDKLDIFFDKRSRYNRFEAVDAFDMKILDDRLVQVGL